MVHAPLKNIKDYLKQVWIFRVFFMCKGNIPFPQGPWLCRIIYIENQEFHGETTQIAYNRERIGIKILAKKSQGIYKQGLLENSKNYFKF